MGVTGVAAYIRVSTVVQASKGESLEEQRRLVIDKYPDATVYVDVMSGKRNDRPEYQRMLAEAAEGKFNLLVCWRFDRLGRDAVERLTAEATLRKFGVEIESLTEGTTNPDDPTGIILSAVRASMAQAESAQISVRVKMALKASTRRGRQHPSRYVPLGYRPDAKGGRSVPVINRETAWIATRIFDERASGRSYTGICADLIADGITTPSGGKVWHPSTVIKILANPIYVGRVLDPDSRELRPALNEALIDQAVWDRVQALGKVEKRMPGQGRGVQRQHLLSGLLRCSCGENMVVKSARKQRHARYVCRLRATYGSKACAAPTVLISVADGAVIGFWLKVGVDYEATRTQVANEIDQRRGEIDAMAAMSLREAGEARASLDRVKRDYVKGEITAAEWKSLREELTADMEATEAEAARHAALLEEVVQLDDGAVTEAIEQLRTALAEGTGGGENVEAARAALATVFTCFIVEPFDRISSTDPSLGSESYVTEGMLKHEIDLVPVLRDGIETVIPSGLPLRVEKSTSQR